MVRAERTLELALYRLKSGVTPDQFMAASDHVSAWIQKQDGFLSRDVTKLEEDDRWIEVIWWETREHASAAFAAAETSPTCSPMFGMIDMESLLMLHGKAIRPTVRVPGAEAA